MKRREWKASHDGKQGIWIWTPSGGPFVIHQTYGKANEYRLVHKLFGTQTTYKTLAGAKIAASRWGRS